MIVTSNGTISVARNSTKIVRFNGNSRNANAYAARIAVAICPSVMKNVDDEAVAEVQRHVALVPRVGVVAPLRVRREERRRAGDESRRGQQRVHDRDVDGKQHDDREHREQDVARDRAALAAPPALDGARRSIAAVATSSVVTTSAGIVHPPFEEPQLDQREHEHDHEQRDRLHRGLPLVPLLEERACRSST